MSNDGDLVRFPNESVKLDDVEEDKIPTALEVICQGGSLDGKIADLRTRDIERLVAGFHGVIGISSKLMSAQSASIFAAVERSFATPASLLNTITAVCG